MPRALVYFPGPVLSLAELSAASIDGDLVAVGEGYAPADAVETPAMRARSLAHVIGDDLAACGLTAAWIHGALDSLPVPTHVRRAGPRRRGRAPSRLLHYQDVRLPESALIRLGGVLVTTPARTLADLVRLDDDRALAAGHQVACLYPGHVADAVELLEGMGAVPGRRAGLGRLHRWAGQDVVTR